MKKLTRQNGLRKTKNQNPICTEKATASADVLLQINEDNFETLKKLQPLSCCPLEIGDYIVLNKGGFRDQEILDKDLKPKSFPGAAKDFFYTLNEEKTILFEHRKNKKDNTFHFRKIITDDDLNTAIMFKPSAKKGMYIVDNDVLKETDFLENYEILKT